MVNHNEYNEDCWKTFRDQAVPICDAIKLAKSSILYFASYPQDLLKEVCPSFHIKGLCKASFVCARYHQPYLAGADRSLMEWMRRSIPGRGCGGDGGKRRLRSGPETRDN